LGTEAWLIRRHRSSGQVVFLALFLAFVGMAGIHLTLSSQIARSVIMATAALRLHAIVQRRARGEDMERSEAFAEIVAAFSTD